MISYVQNMVRLFQHSRQFYYITTDLRGNYTYVNHYFREQFGHLADDFIGTSFLSSICSEDIEKAQDAISLCLAEPGKPVTVELRKPSDHDHFFWTSWEVSSLQGNDGEVKGVQFIGVDITRKRVIQQAVELSEKRYQYIFDEEPLPTWIYDLETLRFLEVNKAALQLYGYSEQEFKNMTILEIRPEECRAEFLQLIKNPELPINKLNRHHRHTKKSGEEILVDIHSFGLNFEGKKARFVTAIDITHNFRQQQELEAISARLKNANDELNSILENVSEAIFKLDPDSNLIYVSPEFTRLTGYPAAEVIGKRWFDIIHPEDLDTCYHAFGQVFQGKQVMHNIRYRVRHSNGNYRWFSTSATFVSNDQQEVLYGIGISHDVTERKYAEDALEASEERYKTFISQSTEAIWRYELEIPISINEPAEKIIAHLQKHGFIAECNDIMAKMYGQQSSAQLVGTRIDEFVDLKDTQNKEAMIAFVENGFKATEIESRSVDAQGNTHYFLNNLVGMIENGMLKRTWGTQREITEKRLAEEKIHYLASLTENVYDAVMGSDMQFIIKSFNKAAEKLYGIPAEKVIGRRIQDFVELRYHSTSRQEILETLDKDGSWAGEASFIRPSDQQLVVFMSTLSIVKDEEGRATGMVAVNKDITDKKAAEEKINFLAKLVENTTDILTSADIAFNVLTWNKAAEKIYGLTSAQVMGKNVADFLDLKYHNSSRDEVRKEINEKGVWRGEMSFIRHTDKRHVTLLIHFTPLKDSNDKTIGYIIGGTDITDRKEAEFLLRESEERFRQVADSAPVMIWMCDGNNHTYYVNRYWKEFTGVSEKELLENVWKRVIHPRDFEESARNFNEHFGLKKPVKMVYRLQSKSGEYRWVMDISTPRVLEDGTFLGFIGSIVDIHDQKVREDMLRFQANILENVSDIIVTTDLQHHIVSWNKAAEQIYGVTAYEAIGRPFTALVKFDYLEASDAEVGLSYRNNGIWKGEVSFVDKGGQVKYLLITASSVYDEKGRQTGYINVARDISDRKLAEQQLQQSELFYRNLIGDSLDGILLTDETGNITFVAYSISKILGFEVEDLIGRNVFDFAHPDDRQVALESFANELENKPKVKFIVIRLPKKDGGWLWCMVRGHNLLSNPYVKSMVIYFHDDSLRKQAEDEVKKASQRLSTAQHIAGLAYMEINTKIGTIFHSEEMCSVLGMPREQMPSDVRNLLALVHPADRSKVKSDIEGAIGTEGTIQHEFRLLLPGTEKIIQSIGYLDTDGESSPTLKITVQDVTTIRAAQLALLNSESKFRSLFESSIDGIILTQAGGSVRSANPAICEMLGYTQDEITQKKRWDIFDFNNQRLEDDRNQNGSFKGELFLLHKDGHRIPCEVSSVLFTDSQGRSYHSTIVRDITKQKEAEEELKNREMILSATNQKLEVAINDLNKIMDYSMDVICSFNEHGEFIQVSAASEKVWGYKPDEVIGKKFTDFVIRSGNDDSSPLNELLREGESVSSNFEIQFRCKDGTPVFLEWSAYWYEKESIAFCVARDITLQKEIEKQLVASETRFRAFMNNSPAFSWIADEEGNLMYLNKASLDTLPVTPKDIGKKIFDLFPPTVAASFHQNNLSVLMMNKPAETIEQVPFKNGSIGTVLVYLFPIHFEENAGKRLVGCVAIDISAKTKAEEALRYSERNLNAIFSSTKDAFFLLDKNLNVVAYNKEAEIWFTTYTKGKDVQNSPNPISFLPEERQGIVRSNMEKVLKGAGVEYEVEYTLTDERTWFNTVMQPVIGSNGEIDGVCVSIADITSKKLAEEKIKETANQLTNIMETISDGMFILNNDLTVKYMNRSAEELLQVDRKTFVGKHKNEVLAYFGASADSPETTFHYIDRAIEKRKMISFTEYYRELNLWYEGEIYPIGSGVTIYFRDVTERKRQDMTLRLEKEVLEMNAMAESALDVTVQHFLKGIEKIHPSVKCSVLLRREDKQRVKALSAPGISKEFLKALDGMQIGPNSASCGTAMFRKKAVYVSSIETDPLWKDLKTVALKNNLRACWSIPIINAQNEVLGSFATYYPYPKVPDNLEVNAIDRATNILRVIIENKLSEEQIRMSNQRYHFVTKATNEAIWDLDLITNTLYWAEGYHTLFGYDPMKVWGSLADSQQRIHPSDIDRIEKSLKSFLRKKTRTKWEDEYRYKKADGTYAYVLDKAYLIHDNKGNPTRLIGSMQDITGRRELEQKLLEQEIGKQKLLTQATIESQEKERKEIGKELHDNINQILSTTKLYLDLAENTATGPTAEMIGMGSKNIMEAINEIRKLSRSLVPPTLGDLGLIESIKDLCEDFNYTRTFEVTFEHRNIKENKLADNQKLMLFRIIQEQTNNIVKHAKAKHVIISLRATKGSINLEITDDGQGFNLKKTKKGVGLTNIINRAELFNGQVEIVTGQGKGCTIRVNVPLGN